MTKAPSSQARRPWLVVAVTTTLVATAAATADAAPNDDAERARRAAGTTTNAAAAPATTTTATTTDSLMVEDGLQQLLDEALQANLELRVSSLTVRQRLAALDQARARYLPAIDFAARYTVADGGRTIDIPVGDLVNPVYETLEQLLAAQGTPTAFPRVQNQSIDLLRSPEQETKLVLAQPLYEPRLGPAVDANRAHVARAESGRSPIAIASTRSMPLRLAVRTNSISPVPVSLKNTMPVPECASSLASKHGTPERPSAASSGPMSIGRSPATR